MATAVRARAGTPARGPGEVAERLSAEEARSRLETILELTDDAIFAVSLEGVIVAWNPGAERIYGYSADSIIGQPISILIPPDRRHELDRTLEGVARGATVDRFETVRLRSDGVPIDVSLSVAPVHDRNGQVEGVLAIARDITAAQEALRQAEQSSVQLSEREGMLQRALVSLRKSHEETKAAQLQLIQAAKLESVGRLAAGVAHEVKNPLAVVLFALDYLSRTGVTADEDAAVALADAREAVLRADAVIRGLLEFSTGTELDPSPQNVNRIIEKAMLLIRHALHKSHVELIRDLDPRLPMSMLDRSKIEQVFVNLMINAIDAMPSGGFLTVRTRRDRLKSPSGDVGYRKTDRFRVGQSVVMIEIEDTGTGIDEKSLTRLFDPFFTTKAPGRGTGLGLAVCKSIVALHGGTIRISNRSGGGARATVVLPSAGSSEERRADG